MHSLSAAVNLHSVCGGSAQLRDRDRITLRQYPKEANKPVVAERAKIEIVGQA